ESLFVGANIDLELDRKTKNAGDARAAAEKASPIFGGFLVNGLNKATGGAFDLLDKAKTEQRIKNEPKAARATANSALGLDIINETNELLEFTVRKKSYAGGAHEPKSESIEGL